MRKEDGTFSESLGGRGGGASWWKLGRLLEKLQRQCAWLGLHPRADLRVTYLEPHEAGVQPPGQLPVVTYSPPLLGSTKLLAVHAHHQPRLQTGSRALGRSTAVGVPRTHCPHEAPGPALSPTCKCPRPSTEKGRPQRPRPGTVWWRLARSWLPDVLVATPSRPRAASS